MRGTSALHLKNLTKLEAFYQILSLLIMHVKACIPAPGRGNFPPGYFRSITFQTVWRITATTKGTRKDFQNAASTSSKSPCYLRGHHVINHQSSALVALAVGARLSMIHREILQLTRKEKYTDMQRVNNRVSMTSKHLLRMMRKCDPVSFFFCFFPPLWISSTL